MQQLKTYALLTGLTLLFIWFGGLLGGQTGMVVAFLFAAGMNFYAYFYSHKNILKHYQAIPVDRNHATGLYRIVEKLTQRANLPMPQIYIIPDSTPNAFATGRNYENAVVAVTEGLLNLMDENEVEAVVAHELSHIKHYDMLIGTIAATIAGAIAMLANFGMMFRGGNERPNPIIMFALMFIMPLAASLIQMTISRNREFLADEGAARMTGNPQWLQSALSKLEHYARQGSMQNADPQTAHMFIINPFTGKNLSFKQLFSTHPTTQQRIARLEELKKL
ncbi:MAG TPA: zinc metalloprotease HtpX [Epsilonproteobacteria bacterium]|nr:zinc metalloprotease HtpX [Campylobacterota bacterium]